MTHHHLTNKGLLPLGLIVSLSITLTGFEYMSSETEKTKKMVSHALPDVTDVVFVPEIPKPEIPKPEVAEQKPIANPTPVSPVNPSGPIETAPVLPKNPFEGNFDSEVEPIKKGFGDQEVVYDPPVIPNGFLDEFPTYEEFLIIKDKDERRTATESKLTTIVMDGTRYPEQAKALGIKGVVHVNFQVDVNGKITNVAVAKSIDPLLDQAAVNAVKKLPNMIPGKKKDKPVISSYTIPVKFVLK